MRLIGIGLLAFVLAAAAFALSYFTVGQQGWKQATEFISGPYLVFETGSRPKPDSRQIKGEAKITRSGAEAPVILSGLPAYQSVSFRLPVDAEPIAGDLQIDLTSQVLEEVEAVLRVNIGNVRRAEVLLRSGEAKRTVSIPLNTRELAAPVLPVALSLQGRGPSSPCGADSGIATVVEIESTSALHLDLAAPVTSARDLAIAWGNDLRVRWPEDLSAKGRVEMLQAAVKLAGARRALSFHSGRGGQMLEPDQLLRLASAVAPKTADDDGGVWISSIVDERNQGLRKFRGSTVWRHSYDLRDMADRRRAVAMELDMALGPLPQGVDWTISATLNGRTVMIDKSPGSVDYSRYITLPPEYQGAENTIEVSAIAAVNPEGICNDGPLLLAELRDSSRLIGGGAEWMSPHLALRDWLASAGSAVMTSTRLTAAEAEIATDLLSTMLPADMTFVADNAVVHIEVLGRGERHDDITSGDAWLVLASTDGSGDPQVRSPEGGPFQIPADAPVALRVTFPRAVADVAAKP